VHVVSRCLSRPSLPCLRLLPQLGLHAEALRRQAKGLRVDLTIYRSSLAFMDSPLQERQGHMGADPGRKLTMPCSHPL
jgi:hypothetical protein